MAGGVIILICIGKPQKLSHWCHASYNKICDWRKWAVWELAHRQWTPIDTKYNATVKYEAVMVWADVTYHIEKKVCGCSIELFQPSFENKI